MRPRGRSRGGGPTQRSESGATREVANLPNKFSSNMDTGTGMMGTVGVRYTRTMETVWAGGEAADIKDDKGMRITTKGCMYVGMIDR